MEHGGRERVGVREQDAVCALSEKVLVPAVDTRDVRELPALPLRPGIAADLGVDPPVLGVPRRLVGIGERPGERRLPGRLGSQHTHAADGAHLRESAAHGMTYDPRSVDGTRRLSQAISEGDGISLLVEVDSDDGARAAAGLGAEGLVLRRGAAGIREATPLPVLLYGGSATDADAVVIAAEHDGARQATLVEDATRRGVECVFEVHDEGELERLLEEHDPEVLLLSAAGADGEQTALDRVLELLEDVPAGKLAVAELHGLDREELDALERAGMDAVIVGPVDVAALAGEDAPA